jgi:predicted  nucleic acid-binding Zn-ribbon protein
MGEESILGLLPRRTVAASPRENATNILARLGTADTAIADFEREERALIQQLEQQRSRIALLTMQIQGDAARAARRRPEEQTAHEALGHVVDLESTRQSRVRAFEDSLTRLHARLVEWRRRRDLQSWEREALIRALEAPVRAAYERAVRNGRTPAIALLQDGACSACHAPVTWAEPVKDAVFSCWQCQRLLTVPV